MLDSHTMPVLIALLQCLASLRLQSVDNTRVNEDYSIVKVPHVNAFYCRLFRRNAT